MFSQFSVCVKVSININYSQVTIMGKAHLTYGRIYLYIYISDMVDSTCLSVSIIWKPWCDFLIHLIHIIHIVSLLDYDYCAYRFSSIILLVWPLLCYPHRSYLGLYLLIWSWLLILMAPSLLINICGYKVLCMSEICWSNLNFILFVIFS